MIFIKSCKIWWASEFKLPKTSFVIYQKNQHNILDLPVNFHDIWSRIEEFLNFPHLFYIVLIEQKENTIPYTDV